MTSKELAVELREMAETAEEKEMKYPLHPDKAREIADCIDRLRAKIKTLKGKK